MATNRIPAGAYLKDVRFSGPVTGGKDCVLERCEIDAQESLYGFTCAKDAQGRYLGATLIDCVIRNADKGILGANLRVIGTAQEAARIEDMANDGIFAAGDNGYVSGVVFRRLGDVAMAKRIAAKKGSPYSPPHADCVQVMGFKNWKVIGNYGDVMPDAAHPVVNSFAYFEAEHGDCENCAANGNWMNGGIYCAWAIDHRVGNVIQRQISTTVEFKNNTVFSFDKGAFQAPRMSPLVLATNNVSGARNY